MTDIDIMDVDLAWRQQMWTEVMNFLRPEHVDPRTLAYRDNLPDFADKLWRDDFTWYCLLSALGHNDLTVSARAAHAGRGLRLWVTNRKDCEDTGSHIGPSKYAARTVVSTLTGLLSILEISAADLTAWHFTITLQQHSNEIGVEIILYPRGDSFMAYVCKRFYEKFREDSAYTANPALIWALNGMEGQPFRIDWEKGATNVQSEDSP